MVFGELKQIIVDLIGMVRIGQQASELQLP
jgi:hypothetical protein